MLRPGCPCCYACLGGWFARIWGIVPKRVLGVNRDGAGLVGWVTDEGFMG